MFITRTLWYKLFVQEIGREMSQATLVRDYFLVWVIKILDREK